MSIPEPFTLADLGDVNAAYLEHIRRRSLGELQQRVEALTVPWQGGEHHAEEARQILNQYGVVVFPEVVPRSLCIRASRAVTDMFDEYAHSGEEILEDDRALFQVGVAKLKGYYKLSNYGKAVIMVRPGQDEGMVDIFNCDLALPEALGVFRKVFEDDYVMSLMGELRAANLNVYMNRGIAKTRGFHVDSYGEHMKAFVYMTDVVSLDDGPYTYVVGSHRESAFRRINRFLCADFTPSTESPLVDVESIVPMLAPMGSLVISDQSGSHRGWPQLKDHERMVAVMKYA
jgi:hypothetical protein